MSELDSSKKRTKLTLNKGKLQLKPANRDAIKNDINQKLQSGSITVEIKKKKRDLSSGSQGHTQTLGEGKTKADHHLTDKEIDARARVLKQAEEINIQKAQQLLKERDEQKRKLELEKEIAKESLASEDPADIALSDDSNQEEAALPSSSVEEDSNTKDSQSEPIDARAVKSERNEHTTTSGHKPGHDIKKKDDIDNDDEKVVSKKSKYRKEELGKKRKLSIVDAIIEETTVNNDLSATDNVVLETPKPLKVYKIKKSYGNKKSKPKIIREVVLNSSISVKELAAKMCEKANIVLRELIKQGESVDINSVIDIDVAELIVGELGHICKRVQGTDIISLMNEMEKESEGVSMISRPPVVTVMGHVDHGKTSILDVCRRSSVVLGEAGGITQHIGAYMVVTDSNNKITFIDTPGHAAFTEMRARGTRVTDIVVLVVSADDGIMEQTVEAISHAKSAGVPIIVAINKIDTPGANPTKIRHELLSHELVGEEFGGETIIVEVSAKTGQGIDNLIESILLQAEMSDLKAQEKRKAFGTVIESKVEKGLGNTASLLVSQGTLKSSDVIVSGESYGKVRVMVNDNGKGIKEAFPSYVVKVSGLNSVPSAGSRFYVMDSEKQARNFADMCTEQQKIDSSKNNQAVKAAQTIDDLFAQSTVQEQVINLIIKTDVHGSVEAISNSLLKFNEQPENIDNNIRVNVVHRGVGSVSESDVRLAQTTGSIIIAFSINSERSAVELAAREGLKIKYYNIIYEIIEEVESLITAILDSGVKEKSLGKAKVKQVFEVGKASRIAGSIVTEGAMYKGAKIRIFRDDQVIYEGNLRTLKRFKDDVKEVKEKFECGIGFDHFNEVKEYDIIECFELISS